MSRLALGPTQCSIQWILGAVSPRVKWPGHEADHSPPSCAMVKNTWSYTSTPPYVFMARCLIKQRLMVSSHLCTCGAPHSPITLLSLSQEFPSADGLCVFINMCKIHPSFQIDAVRLPLTLVCISFCFNFTILLLEPSIIPLQFCLTVQQHLTPLTFRSSNKSGEEKELSMFLLSQSDFSLLYM